MKTHGVKYLGAKTKLIPQIMEAIGQAGDVRTAIDVFTGTTRVAQAMRASGIQVTTSDMSAYSQVFSECYIQATQVEIDQVTPDFDYLIRCAEARKYCGWISENYADVTGDGGSVVRFIHPKNAALADGIREEIEDLRVQYEREQPSPSVCTSVLVTSLIEAMDRVDNTVGVQQAYLKNWCKRSLNDLELRLPVIPEGPVGSHIRGDVLSIDYPAADLAYVDSPYSPHSYATYYHIWDSVALWDKPDVGLRTNRRIDRIGDRTPKSPWNHHSTAPDAFRALFARLPVKNILVSYGSDSKIMASETLLSICEEFGAVTTWSIDYKRNIMSSIGNAASNDEKQTKNCELLFLICR